MPRNSTDQTLSDGLSLIALARYGKDTHTIAADLLLALTAAHMLKTAQSTMHRTINSDRLRIIN